MAKKRTTAGAGRRRAVASAGAGTGVVGGDVGAGGKVSGAGASVGKVSVRGVAGHPRVAILVETSTSWGRRIIEGIGSYARVHGPWEFYLEARGINESIPVPTGWRGEGIIARVRSKALAEQIVKLGVPAVNVSSVEVPEAAGFPRVLVDERTQAEHVLRHFRERGFTNFAYCGEFRLSFVRTRVAVFEEVVRRAGFACHVYAGSTRPLGYAAAQEDRARWLRSLPKPVGVVSWNAVAARRTAEACRWAGIHIPEEVAIVAGSSDDLMIEMVHPPITAVEMPLEKLGYEAAAALDRMMKGGPRPADVLLTDGITVEPRQSTDVLAVDEPSIREALRFIRENAGSPIGVPDVLSAVAVSRRVLERRFREVLGRTPAQEIRRVHLERAKQLLTQTSLSVSEVATASGFLYVERLIPVFRGEVGMTPLQYRKRMRPG